MFKKWCGLLHYLFPLPKGYDLVGYEGLDGNTRCYTYTYDYDAKMSGDTFYGYMPACKAAWAHYAEANEFNLWHIWMWENRITLNVLFCILCLLVMLVDYRFIEHAYPTKFQWLIGFLSFCFDIFTLWVIEPKMAPPKQSK